MLSILRFALAGLAALATESAPAQALPEPPVARVPSSTLVGLPKGSFLESIVATQDGRLLVADHANHLLLRFDPASGRLEQLAKLDFEVRGLALDLDDGLFASGKAENGRESIFRIDASGRVTVVAELPDAKFLNGMALLQPGVLLAADSFGDALWRIDTRSGRVDAWFRDARIGPNPQLPLIPGGNGVKLRNGAVYLSNSGRAEIWRIGILPGGQAGEASLHAKNLLIDDFAFAANGDLYGTTHILNSVVVLATDGARRTIALAEDGVTGSTALVFGTGKNDRTTVYVVGDGGIFQPPPGGVVAPGIVALSAGVGGLVREDALSWVPRPATIAQVETHLVQCETASGTAALRATVGPRYLRYLELNNDRIAFAGQLYARGGDEPTARLYFVETNSPESARRYIEASPYYAAGMYSACTTTPFKAILGSRLGGVAWPDEASRSR